MVTISYRNEAVVNSKLNCGQETLHSSAWTVQYLTSCSLASFTRVCFNGGHHGDCECNTQESLRWCRGLSRFGVFWGGFTTLSEVAVLLFSMFPVWMLRKGVGSTKSNKWGFYSASLQQGQSYIMKNSRKLLFFPSLATGNHRIVLANLASWTLVRPSSYGGTPQGTLLGNCKCYCSCQLFSIVQKRQQQRTLWST